MKDLTKYFIDLSKCTEEQWKHIFSLLPKSVLECQYEIDDYNFMLDYEDDEWWVNGTKPPIYKTELTYSEFIKLFEDGKENKRELLIKFAHYIQGWKNQGLDFDCVEREVDKFLNSK